MTAVDTAPEPAAAPPPKEEQPRIVTRDKRHTGWKLLGIAVVWVVGWSLLKGQNTLAVPFQQLNSFDTWINGLRDDIQAAAQTNWFFHGVIGNISDFFNWLVHLANHRVPMLWRFHELHHSQEDMNVLTVFRTHPLIHVSYLLAVVPALVLLANGELPTLLLVFYGGAVAFAHSNTNLSFGPLDRVFVSPNYHRIHHRVTGAQDVNLGFALTIWDQLTHRANFPTPATVGADTGLSQRPLRVEQQGSRAHHLSVLAAQMLGPFRPMKEPVTLPSVKAPGPKTSGVANGQPEARR